MYRFFYFFYSETPMTSYLIAKTPTRVVRWYQLHMCTRAARNGWCEVIWVKRRGHVYLCVKCNWNKTARSLRIVENRLSFKRARQTLTEMAIVPMCINQRKCDADDLRLNHSSCTPLLCCAIHIVLRTKTNTIQTLSENRQKLIIQ